MVNLGQDPAVIDYFAVVEDAHHCGIGQA
jgi:hypothetical protein